MPSKDASPTHTLSSDWSSKADIVWTPPKHSKVSVFKTFLQFVRVYFYPVSISSLNISQNTRKHWKHIVIFFLTGW